MKRLTPALLAAITICGAIAAFGQPRPAVAALLSYLAVSTVAGRRIALLACLAVAVGLTAASPPHHPAEPPTVESR